MSCYYIYKEKQYQELDDLYPVLLGEMEAQESVIKVENGKETTVKINTELFPDKKETFLKPQNLFTVKPIQSADKKAIIKASVATQYIGFGEGIEGFKNWVDNFQKVSSNSSQEVQQDFNTPTDISTFAEEALKCK